MTAALGPGAVALASSAAVARLGWTLRDRVPGGSRWQRTNHRGEVVTMWEGPCWAAGALAALVLAPGLTPRQRAAALTATGAAAVLGGVDDLTESGSSKGLRGHLGALRRGTVTTGTLKVLGISAAGVVAAAILQAPTPGLKAPRVAVRPRTSVNRLASASVDVIVGGGVIAGTANLLNLLDLRPGRALKVGLLHSPGLLAGGPSAITTGALSGAGLALIGPDLDERSMLGDCGANALGALLGVNVLLATADSARRRSLRALALAGLVGLTLASERISFTTVIAATPGLRELDAVGRRPPT